MRVMAIDYGDVRTGVALSDATGFLAGQTFLIKSRKEEVVLEELAALARREGAQELVMGYPRNMDGTLGPRAEKYAAFARRRDGGRHCCHYRGIPRRLQGKREKSPEKLFPSCRRRGMTLTKKPPSR